MKFFVDTAEIEAIRELAATGLLDGVTTNPSLIAKSGRDFKEVTKEICGIVDGPVSAEVVALDHATMMKEAEVLRKIADNVCIKVPLTVDGLKTCKALSGEGTMVNVTLCFSANQALLAAKSGASFISPFVGRHDDNGFDGMDLIEDIRLIYDNYAFATEILVASVRHTTHVLQAAKIGADVMTAPPKVIHDLFTHVLTDIETLNQRAIHDPYYDVTAISFHAYPYLQDNYALMACGGSVGDGYGPMIIAARPMSTDEVKKVRIAVPGVLTTAFLSASKVTAASSALASAPIRPPAKQSPAPVGS